MLTPVRTFVLFALIPIIFGIYTSSVWEDYYIAFRVSKNLAEGHGLVYTVGERVHAFTSPLGVLIPALCSAVAGTDHDDVALWLYRIICASFLGSAGALLCRVLQMQGLSPALLWGVLGLIAFDAKIVMYSSDGMETPILLFFYCLELYALVTSSKNGTWLLGLSWGGIMWTRPDGFIFAGGLAAGMFIFQAGASSGHSRAWLLKQYFMAACLAAALYLPWFAWAWSYYGSPIPNTIVAKGLRTHVHLLSSLWDGIKTIVLVPWIFSKVNAIFSQPYPGHHTFPNPGVIWSNTLGLLAGLPLVLPKMSRLTRAMSVSFFVTAFYLFHLMLYHYPWYMPVCALAGFLAMGLAWNDICKYAHVSGWKVMSLPGVLIIGQVAILVLVAYETRIDQKVIEEGNRKPVGLWLSQNAASSHDTVFLEPLGYVGYFSQLKMYDFPGLCSMEVIEARRKLGSDSFALLIEELHPDWLVLRPEEIGTISQEKPDLLTQNYFPVRVFDVTDDLKASHPLTSGQGNADKTFTIYHRTTTKSAGP